MQKITLTNISVIHKYHKTYETGQRELHINGIKVSQLFLFLAER